MPFVSCNMLIFRTTCVTGHNNLMIFSCLWGSFVCKAAGLRTGTLLHPYWCQICVIDISQAVWGVNNVLQHHLHALCSETAVWSSAVNHRFDFAYLEDAVTSSNNTTLCLSLFLPLSSPSPSYLSIIKVGIDPFTTLPLSGCSHKAQTSLPSLNQWHLLPLPVLFPHVSFAFLAFALKHDWLKFCTSQFGPFGFFRKYENIRVILIFHGTSKSDGH